MLFRSTGSGVTIVGWANKWRDHGGVVFIDLRDRSGLVQEIGRASCRERV